MKISSPLLSLFLASTALSAPTILERAGGPVPKQIPSSCSINPAYPKDSPSSSAFAMTSDFQAANQVYSYFLDEPSDLEAWNETEKLQTCLEQCYGLGTGCTSVLWAHNVQHRSFGVDSSGVACLFLHIGLSEDDLVPVTNGTYTNAQALDISCPA